MNDVAANVWLSDLGKAFLHCGLRGITYHSPVRPASSLSASIGTHGWVDMVLPTEAIRADSGRRNSGSMAWRVGVLKALISAGNAGVSQRSVNLWMGARKGSTVQGVKLVPSETVAASKHVACRL